MPEPYTPEMRAEDAETIRIMGEDYDLLDNPKARDDFYRIAAQHARMVPWEVVERLIKAVEGTMESQKLAHANAEELNISLSELTWWNPTDAN